MPCFLLYMWFLRRIKTVLPRKTVWAYTGYVWEDLLKEADPARMALLREVDVLVDGRFILEQRTLELRFRGSKNQRLIDVPRALVAGKAVEYTFE